MTVASEPGWLVACLCAAWCGTCNEYRSTFAQLAQVRPDWRFAWVDIEDEADALAPFDLDIENFPTLLIAHGDELRFLGTVLPHASTLTRTLAAAREAPLTALPGPDGAALVGCVRSIGQPLR